TFAPPCLVLHPNGRSFITFLGVAPACLPVPFVGFARNKLKQSWSKLNLESRGTWSRMISRGVVSASIRKLNSWKTPSSYKIKRRSK
ncbi:hypothetical protein HN51_023383, partial [Arachis hypogaea]